MNVADGYAAVQEAVARAMAPDPLLHLDEWAELHVVVPPPSAVPGPYNLAHTPYARRVLQALSPRDPCKRVIVRAASQMLKTQTFICSCLGWIDQGNANILALEPTDKLAKRLSKRVGDSINACDQVKAKVAKPRSRDSRNTVDSKDFDGGTLYITTAGSSSNLAEIPARYVFLDEVDRMERNLDGEGSPAELAEARTTTHEGEQKIYIVSTPTVQGHSEIDDQFDRGTQEHYQVPCPHCGELHQLVQENFRIHRNDEGIVDRAWFVCPACGSEIDEQHKPDMLRDAALGGTACWVVTASGDGETVSLEINAFYAPAGSITWLGLGRQMARADEAEKLGNVDPKRAFQNTRMARSFTYKSNLPEASDLKDRALGYAEFTVPAGGLLLTAGVDVQHDRLAIVIRAWGRGEESWLVYWGEIFGETGSAEAGAWTDLDALLSRRFEHEWGGATLGVVAASIDGSDGSRTEVVNAFCRKRRHRNFMSVKGASEQSNDRREIFAPTPRVVDAGKNLKPAKHGLQQHIVGTARAKDLILETRSRLTGTGPGRMHAYESVRADYWEQLTSEVKIPTGPKRRLTWTKKGGVRNEGLDAEVYALHAARSQKINLLREGHWDALEQRLRQRGLLDPVVEDATVVSETPAPDVAADQADDQADTQPAVQTPAQPTNNPPQPATVATLPPAAPPRKKARRGRAGGGFANNW